MRRRSITQALRHSFRPNLEALSDRVVPASGVSAATSTRTRPATAFPPTTAHCGGVTVRLIRDSNHDRVLSGLGDSVVATRRSGASGCYRFDYLRAGTYFVTESISSNYVRTAPVLDSHYTVNLGDGERVTGRHFDNFRKLCPHAVQSFNFTVISPDGKQTTVNNLRGNTHAGDTIVANFTIAPHARPVVVSLVSYNAPGPRFDANTANQQTVFEIATGTFGPGEHSLTVRLPNGNYQVDFVAGPAIDHFGPAGSNIFYTPQCRLLSADNGGAAPASETGSLSGRVFVDRNQDGVLDAPAGDAALPLVQINLFSTDADGNRTFVASTMTAADGTYSFTQLAAGTYVLVESQPNDFDDGLDYAGTAGGWAGEPGSGSDEISNIVLATGQQGENYVFTELAGAASLSGFAGIPDESSPTGYVWVEGQTLTVVLQYVDANGISITLTTEANPQDGSFSLPKSRRRNLHHLDRAAGRLRRGHAADRWNGERRAGWRRRGRQHLDHEIVSTDHDAGIGYAFPIFQTI